MKIIDIFAVYEALNDNSVPINLLGYYKDYDSAITISVGRGIYGGDGVVVKHQAIKIGEDYYLLLEENKIEFN